METTTVRIECSLTGALVLFDAATAFDERVLWALGIATEPEGTSDIVADFPDEEWEDVWRRETSPVMEACRSGELLVDLIERGTFFVRVGEDAASDARSWMRGQGTLVVRSGRLAIAEVADIGRAALPGGEPKLPREVNVPAGAYRIDISHMLPKDPGSIVMGAFWSADEPAIAIQVHRVDAVPSRSETPNFFRFRKDAIAPLLAQVRLYDAVVMKREDDVAILRLMIAPDLSSGYAGVDCADERLRPGDRVRVRLLEKKGGRWSAELVRADGRGSDPR